MKYKKSNSHIHVEIEERYKYVEDNKNAYTIKQLCKAVGLNRSEYYYHKSHRTNIYKENNRKIDVKILEIYNSSKKRYGAPKIQKMLEKEDLHISVKEVRKRMRFLKIKSCIVKKYKPATSNKKVDNTGKENLLKQEFKTDNLREYETFEETELAIFEFIEGWYNRTRIHSSINYKTPYEVESKIA